MSLFITGEYRVNKMKVCHKPVSKNYGQKTLVNPSQPTLVNPSQPTLVTFRKRSLYFLIYFIDFFKIIFI